jgi:hypothetical protein
MRIPQRAQIDVTMNGYAEVSAPGRPLAAAVTQLVPHQLTLRRPTPAAPSRVSPQPRR